MNTKYLFLRGRYYQYRRPIPKHLQHVFKRKEYVVSLRTAEMRTAILRYSVEDEKISALIKCAENQNCNFPLERLNLEKMATKLGLSNISSSQVEHDDIGSFFAPLYQNIQAVGSWAFVTKDQAAALATTVKGHLTWDDFFDRFVELDRNNVSMKLDKRARDKRYNPRRLAIAEFRKIFPEIDNVFDVSRQHAVEFRDHLLDQVEAGKVKYDTASKKLMFNRFMMHTVFSSDYPHLKNPFSDQKIKVHTVGKRRPISEVDAAKISAHFETCDASDELRALNFIAMNTGAGPKELVFLTESDIHLDAVIPYISIGPNEFRNKVKSGGARHRDIPLVGKALEYMKMFPAGFPTYRRYNGAEAFSAASNKHLRVYCDQTIYCYRHRVADLLRNSGCSDSLKDALLGHTTPGMGSHYGNGYTLEVKKNALIKALKIGE